MLLIGTTPKGQKVHMVANGYATCGAGRVSVRLINAGDQLCKRCYNRAFNMFIAELARWETHSPRRHSEIMAVLDSGMPMSEIRARQARREEGARVAREHELAHERFERARIQRIRDDIRAGRNPYAVPATAGDTLF